MLTQWCIIDNSRGDDGNLRYGIENLSCVIFCEMSPGEDITLIKFPNVVTSLPFHCVNGSLLVVVKCCTFGFEAVVRG